MSAIPIYAVPAQPFYQYDGTNSEDLMALIRGNIGNSPFFQVSLLSADSESMSWSLYYNGNLNRTTTINTGDYMNAGGDMVPGSVMDLSYITKS
jgi:hypothetical protein